MYRAKLKLLQCSHSLSHNLSTQYLRQIYVFNACFSFSLPNPECYETIGSGVFGNEAIRVQSMSADLLVYAVNRDEFSADG